MILLWNSEDSETLAMAAGVTPKPAELPPLLEEIRALLPAPMSRVLRVREEDAATPLARFARATGSESLLLIPLGAGARFLLICEGGAGAFGPRRIQEIESLLRSQKPSPVLGWIEEECRKEEAESSRRRSERRLVAFTEAVQALASQKDAEHLAATFQSLLASPGLLTEDAALSRKLEDFYSLRLQNFRLQHLVEIAARMESANALARGLAHDFNNSMGILLGYTAFLREKLATQPELRQELDGIERAAGRAIDLTAKLSSFSKRRGLGRRQDLALESLLSDFLPTMKQSLGSDIVSEIEIQEPLPRIESSPEQIQEILSHLALNSRDAMPEGGRFLLRLRGLDAEEIPSMGCAANAPPGTRWVLLEASDTGCGIPQHLLSRVFEPFFTTKDGKEGAGLGCAMIYSIARAHGGWVEVDSPPGQGARFRVFLPAVS